MMMSAAGAALGGAGGRDIWETARRLGLYGWTDIKLATLIRQHSTNPQPAERVETEAARLVRSLRRGLAVGEVC
jgi:hypothetical protein